MSYWLIYLIVGLLAGFCSGLFGIGGGIIIVPALTILFAQFYFPDHYIMQLATGSSLAAMGIITLVSAITHHKLGALKSKLALKIIPGMIAGAISGVFLADRLPTEFIRWSFVIFLVSVAASILFRKTTDSHIRAGTGTGPYKYDPTLPSIWIIFPLCWGIGVVAGALGISGGILLMPLLLFFHESFSHATATTVACTFPTVMVGAITAAIIGSTKVGLPAYTLGFIYWPAVGCIGLTALLGAPLGAYLNHRLSARILKPIFAILLLLIAWKMLKS